MNTGLSWATWFQTWLWTSLVLWPWVNYLRIPGLKCKMKEVVLKVPFIQVCGSVIISLPLSLHLSDCCWHEMVLYSLLPSLCSHWLDQKFFEMSTESEPSLHVSCCPPFTLCQHSAGPRYCLSSAPFYERLWPNLLTAWHISYPHWTLLKKSEWHWLYLVSPDPAMWDMGKAWSQVQVGKELMVTEVWLSFAALKCYTPIHSLNSWSTILFGSLLCAKYSAGC